MFENYISGTLPNYPPGSSLPKSKEKLSVSEIEAAVCIHFAILPIHLKGGSKEQPYLKAKQIFRFLLLDEGITQEEVAALCAITQEAVCKSLKTVKGYLEVSDPYIVDLWAIKGALTTLPLSSGNVVQMHRRAS